MSFFYLGLAWHAGIGLGAALRLPLWTWLLLGVFGAAGALLVRADPRARLWLAAAMVGSLGAARFQAAQPDFSDETFLAHYNDQGEVTLEGVVVDEPDERDTHVNLRVRVDTALFPESEVGAPVHGLALVRAPRYPPIGFGDRVRASGELETPPAFEDFDYASFLARSGVYSTVRGTTTVLVADETQLICPNDVPGRPGEGRARTWIRCRVFDAGRHIFRFKEQALAAIARIFPEPQASLLSGILLGVESGIPESLKEDFRRTGTSHIVAISGFNITIIAGVFLQVLRRLFGLRWARPVAILGVAIYAILAGADAAVVRAALMGALVILANGLGRRAAGLHALMFAAWAMTIWNPGTLWDVGFQLSVAATLGLILYAEPITEATVRWLARFTARAQAERVVGALSEFTLLTIAAQITTLPLITFYFHQISLVSLLANLFVLPVQPQVMILGGLATLVELGREAVGLALPVGQLAAWAAWPFVTFTIKVVEILSPVSWATLPIGRFSVSALASMYVVLFGLTWLAQEAPEERPLWWQRLAKGLLPGLLIALLGLGAVVTWSSYFARPDGRLHVTFLDVGQGDATLIQTPSGRFVLLDGGPSPNGLAEQLGRRLPFTARRIDLAAALNPGPEGLGGLAGLFGRYEIDMALVAVEPSRANTYRELIEGLASQDVPLQGAEPGMAFDLGGGARLEVLSAGAEQTALQLTYGSASFLFAPDLTAQSSAQLAIEGLVGPTTVLLVPGNGGQDSLSALFVSTTDPWACAISVGVGNEHGDPNPDTLALLVGRTVLRTDERGWIEFVTDGEQLWARTER